jgi:hypothetical protein
VQDESQDALQDESQDALQDESQDALQDESQDETQDVVDLFHRQQRILYHIRQSERTCIRHILVLHSKMIEDDL